ncbi:14833_t:CDS:2 [Funneliformis mosseae]|uniref:14833_t:CDS:1 n=1 Tax=Funneliformis mosseae TaxID=27381 RepID=A0A9N8WLD2_FUNMO|nr:14833_t:CDS:2 [Funneliformis mosseae]
MDFSQLQIKYLVKRNNLTQKLIDVTSNDTDPNNTTPKRIVSERNKKYVLIKNKEGSTGWTMSSVDENKHENNDKQGHTVERPVYMESSEIDDKNSLVNGENNEFEELELPKSALSFDNCEYQEYKERTPITSDDWNSLLLDKNAYVEENESIESVIKKFKRLESESFEMSPNKLNDDVSSLSINYDDIDTFMSMEPDEFFAFWLSQMSPDFQKEYNYHDEMLHKAIYVWDEDELEQQKKSVTKKLGKLRESDEQKANALNFWQNFLKVTAEFRRINSDINQNKDELNDKQDLEIEMSDSPMDLKEQKYKEICMRETNHIIQKVVHTIKKININFESLLLPVNHVSSYHTSTLDVPFEDRETVAEISDFEEVELPTNPVDSGYQSTKINPQLMATSNISVEFSDTEYDSQTNVLIDTLEVEDINNISKDKYIKISSDEDEECSYAEKFEPASNSSDDEIPKQLTEEESEFARFLSELKKKDLNSIQQELNTEVQQLNEQRKREKRDADSVTQTMISECQKLLQLFGIPYIIAPMEAEAQCAELLRLELVDGIVTDDSDVFLFGGTRVYKNMFNQQKYVELYLLQDLEQHMGINREKLIHLAILLGSDYTEGLPGIGVVSAIEILNEFPGEKGLEHFRDWWLDVQNGTSGPENNESDFKKKFRKKMKALLLSKNFPNHRIWDAYYRPLVDDSKVQFQWTIPNLDDLRDFLMENFSWTHEKVDETLVPLMKTFVKKKESNQITLDGFFAYPLSSSKSHQSTRIQRIVDSWRSGETYDNESRSNDGNESSQRRKKRSQKKSIDVITIDSSSNSEQETIHKKRKRQKTKKSLITKLQNFLIKLPKPRSIRKAMYGIEIAKAALVAMQYSKNWNIPVIFF